MSSLSRYIHNVKRYWNLTLWAATFQFKAIGWWAALRLVRQVYYSINTIIFSFWFGQLINILVEIYQNGLSASHEDNLRFAIIWIGALLVADLLFGLNEGLINTLNTQHALVIYFKDIYNKIRMLDWQQLEDPKTEKLMRPTLDQGYWPINTVLNRTLALLTTVITFVVALRLMDLPPLIIIIIILTVVPKGIADFYFVIIDGKVYDKIIPRMIKSSAVAGYFRSLNALYESKIWRFDRYLIDRFVKERSSYEITLRKDSKVYQTINIFTSVVGFFGGVYVLYYLIKKVIERVIPVGTFQFYFTTLQRVRSDILGLFGNVGELADAYRYLGYAYDFMQLEPKFPDGKKDLNPANPPEIVFKDVWFKYPGSKKWALKNVSVRVKSLERLALVGENGAGKTTFLKLLLRTFRPTKGEILIDGVSLNKISLDSWYKLIAFISQDFARFDILQINENIQLEGVEDVAGAPEKLIHAASMAEAHEFIDKLPAKYQTVLSKRIEGGTELSSGQWQKIALSRLFYANRQIVVLDEPTAAIDPISEARIFNNIYHLLKDKTVILVSHRYNTVRAAHNILVFVDGTIVEHGTHKELLAKKGYYAKAYRLQQMKKEL